MIDAPDLTEEPTMKTMGCLLGRTNHQPPTFVLTDRLHRERMVRVSADEVAGTVSNWLAQLGAISPLVEDFGRTLREGDWAAAHAIADTLSVDVTVSA
ncbi:hypothetical protein [Mycolicibacterium chubuense]|nr:hypothetical protein [Mycolicibacterium chubuense]